MAMTERLMGPSGTTVSPLGLGSWGTWDRSSLEATEQTLRLALENGVTYFDVAIYGDHRELADIDGADAQSTDLRFAQAMQRICPPRESYTLAAKGWLPSGGTDAEQGLRNADLRGQLDEFLRRQRTDYVDVLVLGDLMEATDDYTPLLEQVAPLLSSGKARGWAVNNWSAAEVAALAEQARRAGMPGPEFAQLKYGLTRRSVAEGAPYRMLCEREGVRIQASEPFEGGLIFGARSAEASASSRLIGGNIGGTQAQITAATRQMADAAHELGATVAQLALAVPLLNPHTANVLFGARTPQQLEDAVGVQGLLERHGADEIRSAVEPFWFDRGVVAPEASWGTRPDDDPATYVVERR